MIVRFRYPSDERIVWSKEAAESAVGKPLLSRPTDGERVGTITSASVTDDGSLELEAEVLSEASAVEFNLATNAVSGVSFIPQPGHPA